ncbi:organomercurial lyase [Haloarcula nitratireducens]|uniref:Alkylmercury lyase family protein n=1 Tax=Haloarcula nitratireducens TaxID=2487749 RepID=A0AAW4PJ52_9EURY|nr:organomercurial lyase [Halomicroarcula nitratireducens]MBX0297991.1 alkylmercury lyase family protein [Halomicroarcula nitratireducens]
MYDEDCNCGDLAVDQAPEQPTNGDNWAAERPVRTARLPDEMADNMGRFFGESIETFDDMISAFRTVVDGDGIAVDELCHVEEKTPHSAQTTDETYYFRCFYDGIALAYLVDEPVDIRTETPTNEVIEIQASPDSEIDVAPSDAVMSFGVATDYEDLAGDELTAQDVYGAVCPYVKAFQAREDYERWAADAAATTVGIPLDAGMPIAAALTASPMEVAE